LALDKSWEKIPPTLQSFRADCPLTKNFLRMPRSFRADCLLTPKKTTSGYVHKLQGSLARSSKKFWKCPEISGQPALRMTIYLQCWNFWC